MSDEQRGAVDTNQTKKAACGIRYDPDTLDDSTDFDFSAAAQLKPDTEEDPRSNTDSLHSDT